MAHYVSQDDLHSGRIAVTGSMSPEWYGMTKAVLAAELQKLGIGYAPAFAQDVVVLVRGELPDHVVDQRHRWSQQLVDAQGARKHVHVITPTGMARLLKGGRAPCQREDSAHVRATRKSRADAAGFEREAKVRRAIEVHAQRLAEAHYADLGYVVEDTHATEPYDFVAGKKGVWRCVEVKGTRSGRARHVEVTEGEVRSAEQYVTDLVIVSGISVRGSPPIATGGRLQVIHDWDPTPERLRPTAYRYLV